jgi:hypothetical protein
MAGPNFQSSDGDLTVISILQQLANKPEKSPGNVADSSCELLEFSRKKYSNTGQYPGNGNRYPPGHEHGYQAGIEGCKFAPPNFQLKFSKDFPSDAHQQINRGHRNF